MAEETVAQTTEATGDPKADASAVSVAEGEKKTLLETKTTDANAGESKEGDKKDDTGKPDDPEAKAKADAGKENGAPEKYEPFALPDGVVLDEKAQEAFLPIAKELNLSQTQAQKLVELHTQQVVGQTEAWNQQVEDWGKATEKDAVLCAGPGFDVNFGAAQAAYAKVASPELRALLDNTGYGNHPEIGRMFFKISKLIGEDGKPPSGSDTGSGSRSLEDRLYGGKKKT